ncbi:outer membrane beta-barrel protein [Roseibium sp. CAU 1637]|uniref:Outer membrane beta-barrel protein n=1 Tax=Roseibium limicola TaxID=2816037 RepID=A0A939JB15_9HYPH|nr:outer membrane beta-barrel protein [Roseibium limicola]MBO0346988.1 outer membrane beta-barrel protein [Roseibium limicola]
MRTAAVLLLPVVLVAVPVALAQEGAVLLRGSLPEDVQAKQAAQDPAEAESFVVVSDPSLVGAVLPPQSSEGQSPDEMMTGSISVPDEGVFALRAFEDPAPGVATLNQGASTGLSGGAKLVPVARFSERVNSVGRQQRAEGNGVAGRAAPASAQGAAGGSSGGVGTTAEAFDGETRFDAPVGLRVGTFTIFSEASLRGGYSDNLSQTRGGEAGSYVVVEPSVTARSNWARHELSLNLNGSLTTYSTGLDPEKSILAGTALRLDIDPSLTGTGNLSYAYSQESNSTAESAGGVEDVHEISGELGLARELPLATVRGRVGAVRSQYAGASGSSSERNNTLYSTGLRLDANTGAILRPFTSADLLLRRFDASCNSDCEKRNSWGYEMRLGTRVDYGAKLAGDISAGWRAEHLDDETLGDLSGLVAGANLVWSPTRRTTVTAGVNTTFATTTIAGSSGSAIYAGDMRLAHDFSDRLAGELGAGVSLRHYEGVGIDEVTATGLAGLTFAVTRNAALQAKYTYRAFTSSQGGSDYDENSIEAGVRIRH